MLVICGGALAIGAAASLALPLAPFALVVMLGAAVGGCAAALDGLNAGLAALSGLAILAVVQAGYGLGLLAVATALRVCSARGPLKRPGAAKPAGSSLSGLNLSDER